MLERDRIEERLERRSGLPAAADGAIELRLPEVASADERENVAGARVDATSAAWRSGSLKRRSPSATARSAMSCNSGTKVVRTSQSGG